MISPCVPPSQSVEERSHLHQGFHTTWAIGRVCEGRGGGW